MQAWTRRQNVLRTLQTLLPNGVSSVMLPTRRTPLVRDLNFFNVVAKASERENNIKKRPVPPSEATIRAGAVKLLAHPPHERRRGAGVGLPGLL